MDRTRIFISSVQAEFTRERKSLYDYILSDPLLGKFFEPFMFEILPSMDHRADKVYLDAVKQCDIYLGILGKEYGSRVGKGISPTEQEFDCATALHKTRLIFISGHSVKQRHPKQIAFLEKAQKVLVRKRFCSVDELRVAVYASLVRYLTEKEIIRSAPFDASIARKTGLAALGVSKIKDFVRIAHTKRGFPLSPSAPVKHILTRLNLINNNHLTNASLLLFGKQPQKNFINSEVRCAHFHGLNVAKPIPSYKVFKGDVFELVDQAVDFVLSKLNYEVGTRKETIQIPGGYEIPKEIVAEAIVNAVAHRNYTSNGSIQVMLFSNRLEVWNPGSLPMGWTTEKLKKLHSSVPANPLLAEPMYLAGYIERLGTGTADMVRIAKEVGLHEPDFIQEEDGFKVVVYRPSSVQAPSKYRPSTVQAPSKLRPSTVEVRNLVLAIKGEMDRGEIQRILGLKHRGNFRNVYLVPGLKEGVITLKFPEVPNHPKQKYLLTAKGKKLKMKYSK